jgi:hypothetical protein
MLVGMKMLFVFLSAFFGLSAFVSAADPANAAAAVDWSAAWIQNPSAWATLALLVGLELVLGIDNILVITLA